MSQLVMGSMAGPRCMTMPVKVTGAVAGSGGRVTSAVPRTLGARLTRIRWARVITLLLALAVVAAGMLSVLAQANAGPAPQQGDGAVVVGRDAALREHLVAPGDTLWQLAQNAAPGADPREMVDRIMRLNNLAGVDVQVGSVLLIPN